MAATEITTAGRQLVIFGLNGEPYALPIEQVQEIIRYTAPREVSSNTAWIEGVISLRGKIIPVCNLAHRLGINHERDDHAKIVIVETPNGTAGVIVDEVDEVVTLKIGELDDAPGSTDDAIQGIVKLDDKLVVLLDPAAIFAGLDIGIA